MIEPGVVSMRLEPLLPSSVCMVTALRFQTVRVSEPVATWPKPRKSRLRSLKLDIGISRPRVSAAACRRSGWM